MATQCKGSATDRSCFEPPSLPRATSRKDTTKLLTAALERVGPEWYVSPKEGVLSLSTTLFYCKLTMCHQKTRSLSQVQADRRS